MTQLVILSSNIAKSWNWLLPNMQVRHEQFGAWIYFRFSLFSRCLSTLPQWWYEFTACVMMIKSPGMFWKTYWSFSKRCPGPIYTEDGAQLLNITSAIVNMPFVTSADIFQKEFDYVVVGGGTSGLTVASRLAENLSVSVLVLEAGPKNLNDDLIEIPAQFGYTLGNPQYDWAFPVAKQKTTGNKDHFWFRGKGLGGTSANNFYLWSKPPAQDVDAIEKLGNPGWNWAQYQKYSMKVETFHPPAEEQTRAYPHTFNPAYRGTEGPVQITIPPHAHTIDKLVQAAMLKNGLQVIDDPYGGNVTGTWIASSNIDPKTWTRSYAANAYLAPNIARDNFYVLADALVSRILLKDVIGSEIKMATGVEFIHNSRKYTVKVRKEVILSAGTVKSPQILEMSGIGRPEVLHKLGIETQVDLPGVGENVQEHVGFDMVYELDPNGGHETLALLADPVIRRLRSVVYSAQGKGLNRLGLTSVSCFPHSIMEENQARAHLKQVEAEVQERCKAGDLPAGLLDQLKHQITALKDEAIPDCEIIIFPGVFSQNVKPDPAKSYITVAPFQNHPLSRGTIHAETMDPFAPPKIDPNYFEYRSDFNIQIQYFKFVRQLCDTEPLKSDIVQELDPGLGCKSDADIEDFIRNNAFGIFHAIGSCSMLPREKQGSDYLLHRQVYGTSNLRVADISILPIHIAAHTQATAYMIGEKAADLIKADAE
ncbi:hypothetical protein D9613_004013 [Agrocybe pediades]|uniref:pyranose dehydrogenase (acceptor) n=1 Tax=Agrocybe pediades TaxID=84607 RepID=A0A8H4VJG0_9AGAR|nr:hypothetical protein D9613_004013 [Agrocybe pediades]